MPDYAILNGPFGGSWLVKVRQDEKGIFLEDGWENFRVHHSLVSWACLLLTHCGNWRFKVDIFEASGLEKKSIDAGGNNETGSSDVKSKRSGQGGNIEAGSSGVKDKRCKQGRNNEDDTPTLESKRGMLGGNKEAGLSGEKGGNNEDGTSSVKSKGGTLGKYRSRANWNSRELRSLFLDACLDKASERTSSGNLTSESWEKVQLFFNEKTNDHFTVQQLLSHWKYLRRKYVIWSDIITLAGNAHYDPVANKISWNEEQWQAYIKVNPDARQFRYKPLEYLEKMKLLFGRREESDLESSM